MTAVNGLDTDQIKMLKMMADDAASDFADAAAAVAGSPDAATWNACRRYLLSGTKRLAHVQASLKVALEERDWCAGCGDGAPGEVAKADGTLHPCPTCGGGR